VSREGVEAGLCDVAALTANDEFQTHPDLSGMTATDRLFLECRHPEERWDRALKMVLAKTRAERASLYLLRAGKLHLVATQPEGEPPADIVDELSALVSGATQRYASSPVEKADDYDESLEGDFDSEPATLTVLAHADERQIRPHQLCVLSAFSTGIMRIVGGIVVSSESDASSTLARDALSGIARALWEGGDVSTSSSEASLRQ
jgi:hypothetical protein